MQSSKHFNKNTKNEYFTPSPNRCVRYRREGTFCRLPGVYRMIGILLLTHEPLGQAFVATVTHVFSGRPSQLEALDVPADQDPDETLRSAKEAVTRLNDGSGVIILTDVMGSTPSNCCDTLIDPGQIEVIAGMSLPVLLSVITYRNDTLDKVIKFALSSGQNGIIHIEKTHPH